MASASCEGSPAIRPLVPSPRTMAFGIAALISVLGGGLAFWGLPVERALGNPGTFTEVPVTATDLVERRASSSPALAADPTASRFIVAAHRTGDSEGGCGLQVSGDRGKGWVGADPVPVLPAGVERCSSPEVAFDRGGTLHYLFLGLAGPGLRPVGAFLTTSSDRAVTFSGPRQVLGPLAFGVRMAIGASGRIHLAWLQAGAEPTAGGFASLDNPVQTAHSDDGGASFSEPLMVAPSGRRWGGPALAVGPDGQVVIAYYDLGDDSRDYEGQPGLPWDGRWSLVTAVSADRGQRFAPAEVVDDAIAPPYRVPSIFTMAPPAVVAGRQSTCVAWSDARHGDPDVLLRCAVRGRWTPARRVNDDPQGNGVWQYLPQLAQAPTGRIDVVFYDRRVRHLRNDQVTVSFAYSYDGAKFSGNVALTRAPSDPTAAPVVRAGTPAELASRLGLLSQDSSSLAAWTDTRNGREGVMAQDVYAAEATLLFASVRPRWAVPGGGAAALGGVGVMALLQHRGRRRRDAP